MKATRPLFMYPFMTVLFYFLDPANSLKHHLVLNNDHRIYFSVSSFGYLIGGRLEVVVQNLTLRPDPSEEFKDDPQYGFVLIRLDQTKNPFLLDPGENHQACMLNSSRSFYNYDLITMSLDPDKGKVLVKCAGDNKLPSIETLPYNPNLSDGPHSSYKHLYKKRSTVTFKTSKNLDTLDEPKLQIKRAVFPSNLTNFSSNQIDSLLIPELKRAPLDFKLHRCRGKEDMPLIMNMDEMGQKSYSFNFSMRVDNEEEEGFYYLTFHNCRGRRGSPYSHLNMRTPTSFNLSMLIYETNYPSNYLSAGVMPLPQMYFMLSVMFFLIGTVWVNFIARQKNNALKIHYLMTILVFAKACSLLFHGINYHYIALDGQPVVTWAYLYYATRSVKGALFFITLALIGTGWSFIKYILSDKDKKIILVIVGLQVIAHIAEIILDESTEGEASIEFWAELCSMVDLFSCIAILYPITWSVKHLEEASRTDGKAAINLKKLELFKRFYIISTIYIYSSRIVTFVFLSMLSYRYSWLAELVSEFSTLIYFIITGYYFQPMPTNPYLLLSTDNDLEEDVLFEMGNTTTTDQETLLPTDNQKVTRRLVEEFV